MNAGVNYVFAVDAVNERGISREAIVGSVR